MRYALRHAAATATRPMGVPHCNVRERALLGVGQSTERAMGGIAGVLDGDRRCRDAFRLAACLGPCVVSGSRGVNNSGPHFAASGQKWLSSRCWWHWCGHPVPRIHAQPRVERSRPVGSELLAVSPCSRGQRSELQDGNPDGQHA